MIRRSNQGKRRRGFKPDAAAGSTRKPERNHIRLRGVGSQQYRKSPRLSQAGTSVRAYSSERFYDHQDHDANHQNRRHLIDNAVEFWLLVLRSAAKSFTHLEK